MPPLVSVVVPVYNGVAFIDTAIQSILAQTFTDFELLVSDNASTDGTWEALQRYTTDDRVRLTRLTSHCSAPQNFNAVTNCARGEFIKLVCADDVLYPESLAAQVAALVSHPSAVLATSTRDIIDFSGTPVFRNRGLNGLRGEVSGTEAIRWAMVTGGHFGEPMAVLFRRQTLADVGGWDSRFPFEIDLATCCAVLLHGNLIVVPGPLSAFRVSHFQWSAQLARVQVEQTLSFYRELANVHPGLIDRHHLLMGTARARVNALKRRAVYQWLSLKSRSSAQVPS